MNHQDFDPLASIDEPGNSDELVSLARRRALLNGLGKGGTLLAAAAPVTSFARIKTADGKQCTVSGQMSMVMSQAASTNPCAAYHPTYFFSSTTKAINATNFPDNSLRNHLNNLAVGGYRAQETTAAYFKRDTTNVRELLPLNWTGGYNATLKMATLFPGATPINQAVLVRLHARVGSDEAYFIAAYFSALLAAPAGAYEKVPFPASDVQTQFGSANKADAAKLYKLICTLGADLTKLG